MSKTVKIQTVQFSTSTQFKCKYSLIVKNISIFSHFSWEKLFESMIVYKGFAQSYLEPYYYAKTY